jgi:GR25 family glycosyltransferase involved in LPS biosynthesis
MERDCGGALGDGHGEPSANCVQGLKPRKDDPVRMKIGITVHFQFSFFSAGSPQTALSLGEVYRMQGHDVKFINIGEKGNEWYDDISGLRSEWSIVQVKDAKEAEPGFDVIFEIGNHLLTPAQRTAFSCSKHIWLCRKPLLYHDIEASLFPFEKPERELEKMCEIWMIDEHASQNDVEYAELLFRKPVRRVPFVWSPMAVEAHRQDAKSPIWPQVAQMPELADKPWSIHICETNNTSASSCTIPLFIMREVKKKTSLPLAPVVKIHNADNVKNSEFFRFNVLAHVFSDIQDMSGQFIGRQRVLDFVYDPKSILICHNRFLKIRPYLLDAAWVGIPLVYNSPLLKNVLEGIVDGYYENNDILSGCRAFERVVANPPTIEKTIEIRKRIIQVYSPMSERIQKAYKDALIALEGVVALDSVVEKAERPLRVGFCDMWDDFNPTYNQFTLLLEAGGKFLKGAYAPQRGGVRSVEGVDVRSGKEEIDILVFGPFGDTWKKVAPGIPKIHFTGENTDPILGEGIKLNLGFRHVDMNDGKYLRLPLWMLEVNWFHANVERIGNPKPLPISRCCSVAIDEIPQKKKFCAFVVTNPCQPIRNAAFQWISEYKNVDSAGRLFNNVGGEIFAGRGGGGGEILKHNFLKNYKFCLAYENAAAPGYMTEKYLHAKASGCIPIYWGDPKAERDFDMKGCIDARHVKTKEELIRLVKEVDTNPSLWLQKYSVPALDEVRRDIARRTLAECSRRMWSFVVGEEACAGIPEFIGETQDAEEEQEGGVVAPVTPVASVTSVTPSYSVDWNEIVFVTGCNTRFLSSLQTWLRIHKQQKKSAVIVYFMNDVSKEIEQNFIEEFPFITPRRIPQEAPQSFPDLWEAQHFAWKLWILKEICNEEGLKGKPVLYMDTGAVMVRQALGWFKNVELEGISVLEDSTQDNRHWCHEAFCRSLKVIDSELKANQIWAGSMCFVAGAPKAKGLFDEAWKWGQVRDVIVGPKWAGMAADGKPYGHRHDQSILGVLALRMGIKTTPLEEVYCDKSLRLTYLFGKAIYCHRGNFQVHVPVTPGIDDVWVINLDRRKDRLERFTKTHPVLADRMFRLPAFEGSRLKLTPRLKRLFKPHDFNWKKPVMGCALSHLAIWMNLANEKPEVNSYLICEDDARLRPEWQTKWDEAEQAGALPKDWDCIYLGGVLPPNRDGFEAVAVEKVNDHVGRVAVNNVYGQNPPNRYFHFCAYAYVLTRRGAQKILEVLRGKDGYWTSADHMICNIHQFLNIYFLHPLVGGCYQDDDPAYQNAVFNDFSRVDSFDSDLWNNTERFSEAEVNAVATDGMELDILGALEDAKNAMIETFEDRIGKTQTSKEELLSTVQEPVRLGKRRLVTVGGMRTDATKWHEFSWLSRMFGDAVSMQVEHESGLPDDAPIVVVQRPHVEEIRKILLKWQEAGKKFYVLHLSDEYGQDPIDFYSWESCLGVVRNYVREGLPSKVVVIPLGYHWAMTHGEPETHTPRPPFRELVWSFIGTEWQGRKEKLNELEKVPGEHRLELMESWNDPKMLGREETLGVLLNSWCVPCPRGQNPETFRFYEALEAGAVPVLVREDGMDGYFKFLAQWLPLLVATSWQHAAELIHTLRQQPQVYEQYRLKLLEGWRKMKEDSKIAVRKVFDL